jgi:hypothetical protein
MIRSVITRAKKGLDEGEEKLCEMVLDLLMGITWYGFCAGIFRFKDVTFHGEPPVEARITCQSSVDLSLQNKSCNLLLSGVGEHSWIPCLALVR